MHDFDKSYWEQHWTPARAHDSGMPPNPHLIDHARGLPTGTALDAGCGAGAESVWLARQGWRVLGADISAHALEAAARRAEEAGVDDRASWIEADLTTWEPEGHFDLVLTCYAHPTIPQAEFYRRISGWVAVGGSLLIVGHLPGTDTDDAHGHGHGDTHRPAEATVTAADITAALEESGAPWRIDAATESARTIHAHGGEKVLRDAVIRATRLN